jgi:hypothetical protein
VTVGGDWRSQVSQRAVEACAVLEQARAGLVSQRDTVLDAVVAVIVPNADADWLAIHPLDDGTHHDDV